MLRFTTVPVIPLARSEAMKTAMLTISARVVSRCVWVLPAISSWKFPSALTERAVPVLNAG